MNIPPDILLRTVPAVLVLAVSPFAFCAIRSRAREIDGSFGSRASQTNGQTNGHHQINGTEDAGEAEPLLLKPGQPTRDASDAVKGAKAVGNSRMSIRLGIVDTDFKNAIA